MMQLFALQLICSGTVLVMSFLGIRPMIMVIALPIIIGAVWVLV